MDGRQTAKRKMEEEPNRLIKQIAQEKYKYGFTTDVHTEVIERGLNEEVVRLISAKKREPEWLLEFRLKAFRHWQTMEMPAWAHLTIPEIDYQAISYYADPTAKKKGPKSMDEVDPELIKTFDKLGIPLEERMACGIGACYGCVCDKKNSTSAYDNYRVCVEGPVFRAEEIVL